MIATLLLALSVGYAHPEQLVDTAWVAAHARDAGVRILDVRRSGFETGHIPGAVWLDPESIRDPKSAPSVHEPSERFVSTRMFPTPVAIEVGEDLLEGRASAEISAYLSECDLNG